jgi:hypothetical protein
MPSHKDVNLLITPLAMYYEHNLQELDLAAHWSRLHRVPLLRMQHWAIQAGNTVYEVTRRGSDTGKAKFRDISSSSWWRECDNRHATVQVRFLGTSRLTKSKLLDMADYIWIGIMKQEYKFATTNCQTFAKIFQKLIIDNEKITAQKQAKIQKVPMPFNPLIGAGEKAKQVKRMAACSDSAAVKWLGMHKSRALASLSSPPAVSIPRRQSNAWLDALKHESGHREINSTMDFYHLVHLANERLRPKQKPLWKRLRLVLEWKKPERWWLG